MTDNQNQTEDQSAMGQLDELAMLKQRARLMGVEFSNNIGLETLRERIRAKMEGVKSEEDASPVEPNPLVGESAVPVTRLTLRQYLLKEEMKLVRLRITNLDPKKKDLPGEIFTVANEHLGTVRKFVSYGEVTDDGYHVPHCIYRQLESRQFLNIRTTKGRNGQVRVESGWAKEFALEVLPALTREELNRLATAQAAAGSIGD